ncbi:hypothetical protein MPTK1_2g18680 [Marchantia polymorpha subsp. ruderalis]|uniref:Uncharacterized protein n=1 Tax=Marchantia polymorpha TaxID=3197 RepID=A0A2R6W722_MARPO|nr:hypothetical protein MARPO_0137s0014 [Marchantia polymorpha]BBN02850.1 hypothetical protein Mp_2g18680 [Marchantia polymorpha subsp. ruderalis]|eukprot:PTQ29646.1 hypothetical protein MARPO_0137s0014 [Marchantia polymorpha]
MRMFISRKRDTSKDDIGTGVENRFGHDPPNSGTSRNYSHCPCSPALPSPAGPFFIRRAITREPKLFGELLGRRQETALTLPFERTL